MSLINQNYFLNCWIVFGSFVSYQKECIKKSVLRNSLLHVDALWVSEKALGTAKNVGKLYKNTCHGVQIK